ncbi:hypothetical protein [uncultured Brachyspira sp.]|uniref:hypothetical protein n=1 Tax=uncultured Brachyspira sp. TaxID=221953 RepID=UPI00258273B8|nr:hypothetical protein [uncultured Brachyspira sp.]
MEDINERLSNIEYRVGIRKDGTPNSNGILKTIEKINDEIENIYSTLNKKEIEKIQLNVRLDNIEKDIKQMQESLKSIDNNLKDTINVKSFITFKNVLLGIVAVLGGFSAIGVFLYNFLKLIYESGS